MQYVHKVKNYMLRVRLWGEEKEKHKQSKWRSKQDAYQEVTICKSMLDCMVLCCRRFSKNKKLKLEVRGCVLDTKGLVL